MGAFGLQFGAFVVVVCLSLNEFFDVLMDRAIDQAASRKQSR